MQNTILQHIQLPKPRNVLQIWLILQKKKNTKQQKCKGSVLLTRRRFAIIIAFVSAIIIAFVSFELFFFSANLFVWGVEFKGAPFGFEGRYIVIITDCRWFFSMRSPLAPSLVVFFFFLISAVTQLNLLFYKFKKKTTHQKKPPAMRAIVEEELFLNLLTTS